MTQHVLSEAEFDKLFIHLHSLAGGAAMMNLESLSDVTTALEHEMTQNKKEITQETLGVTALPVP